MLDQSINHDSLKFILNSYERNILFKEYFNSIDSENNSLNSLIEDFYRNNIFSSPTTTKLKEKNIYHYYGFSEYIFSKRFIISFKTINNIKQSNRNHIISSILALLKEHKPYTIIRLDIKDFYESIDRNYLFSEICSDSAYSNSTINILEQLFKSFDDNNIIGLPRGLNISAILSEYYIRDFDKECKKMNGVFFYARYVDDIIIFTTNMNTKKEEIQKFLPVGLTFHTKSEKYRIINITTGKNLQKRLDDIVFSYLGYEFNIKFEQKRDGVGEIRKISFTVDMSSEKIKKIKTRIVKSLLDYKQNSNFNLLVKRIKFLTGNYIIYNKSRDTKIRSGIFYNYKYISLNDIDKKDLSLKKLDDFLNFIILSDISSEKILGVKLNLTTKQKKTILKYSFYRGFNNKKFQRFSPKNFKEIKRCWSY